MGTRHHTDAPAREGSDELHAQGCDEGATTGDHDTEAADDGQDAADHREDDGQDAADHREDGGEDGEDATDLDAWLVFEHAVRERHGVADIDLARTHEVELTRFHRRTKREGWGRPSPGIRLHPLVTPSVQQRLLVAITRTPGLAAASRDTAEWLHDLRSWPPVSPTVVAAHACRAHGCLGVHVHRARWLEPEDVTTVGGVPTLSVPAMLLSSARSPAADQRARLIDVLHRGLTTVGDIDALLRRCGPVPGKAMLRALCAELAPFTIESIFQDRVARDLLDLGYPVERSVFTIPTADGTDLHSDIALPRFKVSLETEGDAFHRTREQRRQDRRRMAAYAGTDWVVVPIDWRDWAEERDRVTGAIDAAIDAQRRRGVGATDPHPRDVRRPA